MASKKQFSHFPSHPTDPWTLGLQQVRSHSTYLYECSYNPSSHISDPTITKNLSFDNKCTPGYWDCNRQYPT